METKMKKKSGGVFSRNSYSFASAIIAGLIMLFVYAVWEFFPFGENIILRMDLYHQYAPLFAELYERIFGGHSLLYSFTSGLGSGFLGNYFNYLSSPTMLFVMIFGHFNVPEAVAAMVLVKASASAFTFTHFLNKYTGKKEMSSIAFGILYAFCGYFVAYYWNIMWLDAMVAFPLVILGIYRIIEEGKPLTYVFSLAFIMFTNYYMAYMVCILSVIFFLYLYFSKYSLGTVNYKDIILKNKYKHSLGASIRNSKFLVRGIKFAGASILAAMIAAVALLPVFFILQNSSATDSTFPKTFSTYFNFFDFLANHLAGAEPTIRSSGNTVFPNIYCGIMTLVLVPLFMFSKRFNIKEKIATTAVLGVFFISFNINALNFIWHGFHFPNDLPYRFSFAYSFFLLFVAYRVFTVIDKVSSKEILMSATGVALFAIFVEKIGSANVDLAVVWTSVIFAVIYAVVLAFIKNPKYSKSAIAVLLITAVCAEILIANTNNYKVTQTKDSYTSSYNDTEAAIDIVKKAEGDGNGFYRMELATLLTRMDNCWFFYPGVSTFTSMAYQDVAKLQDKLGMYGNKINSYTYNCQTGLYNSMMSLKYIVDNTSYVPTDTYKAQLKNNFLYEKVEEYNDMTVYKNKYWLPVAFAVNDMTDVAWEYELDNPFDVQNSFYSNAAGVEDILEPLTGTLSDSSNIDSITDDEINSGLFNIYRTNSSVDANEMTFMYKNDVTRNVYLYFKNSAKDIKSLAVIAGDFSYNQSIDSSCYVVDLGEVKAGEEIYISCSLENEKNSTQTSIFLYGLNKDKFVSAYKKINENGVLNVTENKEHYLKGDIKLAAGKMIYTSIPYDKGWNVYIDGEKAADENIVKIGNALMGIKAEAGQHTVELKFVPRGIIAGGAMTVLGILILVVLIILKKKEKLMFSPEYIEDVVELGRWRDKGAEQELKEQEAIEEERIAELLAENEIEMTEEDDDLWNAALTEAQQYAKTVAQTPDEAQQQVDEFNKDAAATVEEPEEYDEYEEDVFGHITTEEELDEFEKATDDIEKPHKTVKPDPEERKTAQKKRRNLVLFVIIAAVAVAAAAGILVYAVNSKKNQDNTGNNGASKLPPIVSVEDTEDEASEAGESELTTVVTTKPTTTTTEPTTPPVTTTKAPTQSSTTAFTGDYITYTVKAGDNFYSILRSLGIKDTPANVDRVCKANGITTSTFYVGLVLKIPTDLR